MAETKPTDVLESQTIGTTNPTDHEEPGVEESEDKRIERLGRQRPEKLQSMWKEVGFVFSIVISQALTEYFISGFTVLIPTVVKDLRIPATAVTWPASALSLVVCAFLLPFGRLADIYGGFWVYILGCGWYAVWSLITGFATNEYMLDVCRALQGLGPAAFLPGGLMLLGSVYRPGPRKNIVFSIYGAMAPFGFFAGIFFSGLTAQYATWRWYFWIGTILTAGSTAIAYFTIPNDYQEHRDNGVKMDWWGTLTTVVGIVLLVFAITDSSQASAGWKSPYILVTFVVGIIVLAIAFYIEGWVAEQPLIPFAAFKIKYVRPFVLGLLLAYGSLGIYILYATLYIRDIMHVGPFQLVAWYCPLGLGGCILATLGGFVFHLIHGNILMFITGVAIIIDSLLFAIQPPHANYWRWVFPAMLCATIAIDIIFSVAAIFFTTALPARQQGFAAALSNVLLQLGIAVLLGFADIVASSTADQGLKQSYKNVFWFELACGVAALVIFTGFVRIQPAKSDKTADERADQNRVDEVEVVPLESI